MLLFIGATPSGRGGSSSCSPCRRRGRGCVALLARSDRIAAVDGRPGEGRQPWVGVREKRREENPDAFDVVPLVQRPFGSNCSGEPNVVAGTGFEPVASGSVTWCWMTEAAEADGSWIPATPASRHGNSLQRQTCATGMGVHRPLDHLAPSPRAAAGNHSR